MNDLGRLLDRLGRGDDERLSVNMQPPGAAFRSRVATVRQVAAREMLPQDRNVWYGSAVLNARVTSGRGAMRDVTGVRELAADLDVKPGGMPSWSAAESAVAELSRMLGTPPVALVRTGHGLQPHWCVERGPETDWSDERDPAWRRAAALWRRWGRLVATVAEAHGGMVDATFDLARILRAPGTVNHKGSPVPVEVEWLDGAPVSLERLGEALDEWGVHERPEDREVPGAMVTPPESWTFATVTCQYARRMVEGWAGDRPDARHPWLVSQATRVAALHRLGCITEQDHAAAVEALRRRFESLLAAPGNRREPAPGELAGAMAWGAAAVAAMSEQRVRAELGDHPHNTVQDLSFDPHEVPREIAPEPSGDVVPAEQPEDDADDDAPDDGPQGLTSHFRMAEILSRDHGQHLRYIHGLGWHVWERGGTHWREDQDGMPTRALHWTLRRQLERGHRLERDPATAEIGKSVVKLARECCRRSDVRGVLDLAGDLAPFATPVAEADADPWLFNTPTGTLNLRTGVQRPHDRADLLTKVSGGGPDTFADVDPFRVFIERILPDPDVRGFVQRMLGQAMLGEVREHILPIWHGTGANGKSTLMELMMAYFGTYAASIRADTLLTHQHTQHPTGIMPLRGARLAFTHETDQGRRFSASLVKQLTGGDRITARRMRQDDVTWAPTHTLVMVTNHAPEVDPDDDAMWRRLIVVPFDVVIPPEERDPDLVRKLRAHLGAVGVWLMAGWREYQSHGLAIPGAVRVRTETYRYESDALGQFLTEQTTRGHGSVGSTELFNRWTSWSRARGEDPGGLVAFAKVMQARGYRKIKNSGIRWQGVTLRDDFSVDGDE